MRERLGALWDKLGLRAKVITLRGRSDREVHARAAAERVGLAIDFFYAERHPKGGTAGCFDSHQRVCREALAAGEKRVLVLEDDFDPTDELFHEEGCKALKEAIDFVHARDDWHIVYLGVLPNVWCEKSVRVGKFMYRLRPWACTHAMILSEAYMRQVASWTFVEEGKDAYDWRHRSCEHAYAFHPQAFKQYESPSDIRATQLPAPPVLRDMPLNVASWYALNIGVSLGHALCVLTVAALVGSLASSSSRHNDTFAKRTLQKAARARMARN